MKRFEPLIEIGIIQMLNAHTYAIKLPFITIEVVGLSLWIETKAHELFIDRTHGFNFSSKQGV